MSPLIAAGVGVLAYLAAAVLLAAARVRGAGSRGLALAAGSLGVAAHTLFHGLVEHAIGGPDLHFFAALALVALVMALLTLVLTWRRPLDTVGVLVFPIAAVMLALDALAGTPTVSSVATDWRITIHVLLALFAYATLSIAALLALLLATQERALRAHRVGVVMRAFPPLTLVESLLFRMIAIGFTLLTAAVLTGVLFVEDLFAQSLAHKTLLSLAAWVVFGVLLWGRHRLGWRGNRAVRWTLAGMLLLLLAFVGSKFVLEIVLGR